MKAASQIVALLVAAAISAASGAPCEDSCYCPTGDSVVCTDRGITQPPAGNWPQITSLDLRENNISVVYKTTFTSFPNVKLLRLRDNFLTELDMEVFAGIPALEELQLLWNKISAVSPGPQGGLPKLTSLSLRDNFISELDPDFLTDVAPNLSSLDLAGNHLVLQDGKALLNHPTLKTLLVDYQHTTLTLSAGNFEGLPQLRVLSVTRSGLTTLGAAFANTQLTSLVAGENRITQLLSGAIGAANSLTRLDLSHNPLTRLDVGAVSGAIADKGYIEIYNTPLACSCEYEGLYWWSVAKGVDIVAHCDDNPTPCVIARKTIE